MSWQEDLRKLDDELAAGRLSADDYRVRRDRVLSTAVSSGGNTPTSTPSEATRLIPVAPGDQPQRSQPSAGGQAPDQGGEDADKTQIVPGQPDDMEQRTQSVGGWHTRRPGDSDRTQIVPGVPPQSVAGGYAKPAPMASPPGGFPQPPGWQPQRDDLVPPWGGTDFPPLAATGNPDWIKQGPEIFDEGGRRGNTGRIVAIVATVVLLAGLSFGAYWLWGRGGDNSNAGGTEGSTTTAPSITTSKPPPDPLPVGDLPGKVTENKAVKTFGDLPGQRYLTQPELDAYQVGQAGKTKLVLSEVDGDRLVVMLVEMPDAASASAAATALTQIQITNGMQADVGSPPKVQVVTRDPQGDQKGRLRGHYVHENIVVRVDLTATTMSAASAAFGDILAAQLKALPADG